MASTLDEKLASIKAASDKCLENAMSNAAINTCSEEKLVSSDALLNQVYQERIKALKIQAEEEKNEMDYLKSGQETINRLVAAQRAWITFRDADCSLRSAAMLHGTGEGMIYGGCLAEKTFQRIKEIVGN